MSPQLPSPAKQSASRVRDLFDDFPDGRCLFAMLRKLGLDADSAEDQVQETFLREREACGTIRSPAAWRRRVARNLGLEYLRKMRSQRFVQLDGFDSVPASSDSPDQLERDELIQAVRASLNRLPKPLRHVVELWMSGRTHREIGELTGKSERACQRYFLQALSQLARNLQAG